MALLRSLSVALAIGVGPLAAWGQADQPRQLAAFFQWRALAAGAPDNPVCYITHVPEAVQAGQRSGPRPMLMIAWRPARVSGSVLTMFAAYRFKAGSEAILEFSPQLAFKLFTVGDTAWAMKPEDDAIIVQALRLAQTVTVRGTNEAGAAVADTFSLTGFTAASMYAIQACPPR